MTDYYKSDAIRQRIADFLACGKGDEFTACYLTAGNRDQPHHLGGPVSTAGLCGLFAASAEIGRSLWDRCCLVADIDIEYVNFDSEAEVFLDPERSFRAQEPTVEATLERLRTHGIQPLHLLTGRGHHFLWCVSRTSRSFRRLAALGELSTSLEALYDAPHPLTGETIDREMGKAFAGLGCLMDFIAADVKRTAAARSFLPVELTALAVGLGERGREMVSLDVSEYGDPLSARSCRVPFSRYFKPLQTGERSCNSLPLVHVIPRTGRPLTEALKLMRDPVRVRELAVSARTQIPEFGAGTERLLDAYLESGIHAFHRWFYSERPHPPEQWAQTYDQTPYEMLPTGTRHILENPNDLLLQPAGIEQVTRVFLALGWHPRHIAGLVHSKFARDFRWKNQWEGYDPATRADFYTRIFTGLFATGVDDLISLNSQSAREQGLLPEGIHPGDLEPYRQSLLNRRRYERLACRPVNGLFLPTEHL